MCVCHCVSICLCVNEISFFFCFHGDSLTMFCGLQLGQQTPVNNVVPRRSMTTPTMATLMSPQQFVDSPGATGGRGGGGGGGGGGAEVKENERCDKKRHEPLTLEQMQEALIHLIKVCMWLFSTAVV